MIRARECRTCQVLLHALTTKTNPCESRKPCEQCHDQQHLGTHRVKTRIHSPAPDAERALDRSAQERQALPTTCALVEERETA